MSERISRVVAVICLILMLTSCVPARKTSSDNLDKHDGITIHWMLFGEKTQNSDDVLRKFNEELQRYFPGTTVELEVIPKESYKEKWDMKMATNETIDLAWIGNDIFNYTEEVKKGSFMAIDYLLSRYGEELVDHIPEYIWDIQKRDGKVYSVPLLGVLYRKDYALIARKGNADRYGDIEMIGVVNRAHRYTSKECYTVIEDYLQRLKEEKELGTGISYQTFARIADKGYEGIYGPDSPFVIKIFDDQLKVYNKYELKNYQTYFKTMSSWYQKGYIREDIEEVLNPMNDDGEITGSALFLDEYGENRVAVDHTPANYETTNEPLQDYKYISYESCRNAVVIPRTSANPQRAVEILNLLSSEEGADLYRLLVNGFEGRHYVKTGENQINKIVDENGKPLYGLSPYAVGNAFLNYESSKGQMAQLKSYNSDAKVSPLLGFELDTRMIVLEMEKIDLVVDEYINKLEMGTSGDWEEVYQEFIRKMKEAGSEKVIREMRKQIQAFRSEKDTNTN